MAKNLGQPIAHVHFPVLRPDPFGDVGVGSILRETPRKAGIGCLIDGLSSGSNR
jgi:hypothetical protein